MKWYAMYVKTGREDLVCRYLNIVLREQNLKYKIIVPKRKIIEYRLGIREIVEKKLFPGYLLIQTESICYFYMIIRKRWHSYMYRVLKTEECFLKIEEHEIQPIIGLINSDGLIEISNIYLEEDRVLVVEGPLAYYSGTIKKINQRKRRAKILVSFLGNTCMIDIGIECLKKLNDENIIKTILFT